MPSKPDTPDTGKSSVEGILLSRIGYWLWRLWIVFMTFVLVPSAVFAQWSGDGLPAWICYWIYAFILTCLGIVLVVEWFRDELPKWRHGEG